MTGKLLVQESLFGTSEVASEPAVPRPGRRWCRVFAIATAPHRDLGGIDAVHALHERATAWCRRAISILERDASPGPLAAIRYPFGDLAVFVRVAGPEAAAILFQRLGPIDKTPQVTWVDRPQPEPPREHGGCPQQWLDAPPARAWIENVYVRGWGHGLELVEGFAKWMGGSLRATDWACGVLGLADRAGQEDGSLAVLRLLAGAVPVGAGDAHHAATAVLGHALTAGWVTSDMEKEPRAYYQTLPHYRSSYAACRYEPQASDDVGMWLRFPEWLARIRERFPWGVANVRRRRAAEGAR